MGISYYPRMGKTYFEFYKAIAPNTECRAWEELSDYARRLWVASAIRAEAKIEDERRGR